MRRGLLGSPLGPLFGPTKGGAMVTMPNEPGKAAMDHEEGRSMPASPEKSPIIAGPRKTGAGSEENWLSLATGDPAFWLKDPDQE